MSKTLAATGALALAPVLAGFLVFAGPGAADESETWRYQCLGDEVVGAKICTTELATFEGGEEFIVYFVHTERGRPPLVVAGEDETLSRATIKVDKNEPLSSRECEDGDCFFAAESSNTLMKQFRKGFRAKVTIWVKGGEIVFDRVLSLRGFTAALTAPRG